MICYSISYKQIRKYKSYLLKYIIYISFYKINKYQYKISQYNKKLRKICFFIEIKYTNCKLVIFLI